GPPRPLGRTPARPPAAPTRHAARDGRGWSLPLCSGEGAGILYPEPAPNRDKSPRSDRYGDPLPPDAVARQFVVGRFPQVVLSSDNVCAHRTVTGLALVSERRYTALSLNTLSVRITSSHSHRGTLAVFTKVVDSFGDEAPQ